MGIAKLFRLNPASIKGFWLHFAPNVFLRKLLSVLDKCAANLRLCFCGYALRAISATMIVRVIELLMLLLNINLPVSHIAPISSWRRQSPT